MTITLYGIPNCDTVRKARKWCDANGIGYEFVDFREQPLDASHVESWLQVLGDSLLNKRSTTWKQLTDEQRDTADGPGLVQLLIENPTLIKRPVLEADGTVSIGFKPEDYAARFGL